jgi:hypothetical protein
MNPDTQKLDERLKKLEQRFERQLLSYPIDANSQQTLFRTMDKNFVDLLRPLETAAANEGTHTLLNNTPCIQFADAATGEGYFSFVPHQNLLLSSMKFIWSTPTADATKNLRWQVDIGEGGVSDVTNVRTTGGTAISTAADGTANELKFTEIHSASGINLNKLKRGNLWGIKFTRLGADASDTLSNTVNLYGILVEYRLYGF